MDSKEQVTKQKNEGRVAAGKRLAEWNRKNKENLLKKKEQEPTSSAQEPNKEPSQEPTSAQVDYTLYVAAAAAGLVAWIFLMRSEKTPVVQSQPSPATPKQPAIDLAMF